MTFDDFDAAVLKRANPELFGSDRALDYGALKLASEAGEVAGLIGKVHHGKNYDDRDIVEELGDVLWYVSYIARRIGSSLEQVAAMNDRKLAERHGEQYNQDFYKGKA